MPTHPSHAHPSLSCLPVPFMPTCPSSPPAPFMPICPFHACLFFSCPPIPLAHLPLSYLPIPVMPTHPSYAHPSLLPTHHFCPPVSFVHPSLSCLPFPLMPLSLSCPSVPFSLTVPFICPLYPLIHLACPFCSQSLSSFHFARCQDCLSLLPTHCSCLPLFLSQAPVLLATTQFHVKNVSGYQYLCLYSMCQVSRDTNQLSLIHI